MMRSENVSVPLAFLFRRASSPCRASILRALLIETSRRSGEVGLTTKSTAPARIAPIAVSSEPLAVCTMIGGPPFLATRRRTSMPSNPGITRSSSTRAIADCSGPSSSCRACSPLWAVLVSYPSRLIVLSRMRRWVGSSSTMRTSLGMRLATLRNKGHGHRCQQADSEPRSHTRLPTGYRRAQSAPRR